MKKTQKITAIILSLAMVIGLCACGEDSNSYENNNYDDTEYISSEEPSNELVGAWLSYENSGTKYDCFNKYCDFIFNNDGTGYVYGPYNQNFLQGFCTYSLNGNGSIYIKYDIESETYTYTYTLEGDNLSITCPDKSIIKLKKASKNNICNDLSKIQGIWVENTWKHRIYKFDEKGNFKVGQIEDNSFSWKRSLENKYKIQNGLICVYNKEVYKGVIFHYNVSSGYITACRAYNEGELSYTKISDDYALNEVEILSLVANM